jgi:site-specific recombinase XerD
LDILILNLPLRQIDFERNLMILKDTKNGEDRNIPLSPFAMDTLRDYLKELSKRLPHLDPETCLLFPSKNIDTPAYIHDAWRKMLKECRIQDYHFHDNRHTFASHLIMAGASLVEAADVLGHKTLAMVKRYSHLSEPHTRTIVERMNTNIFGGM